MAKAANATSTAATPQPKNSRPYFTRGPDGKVRFYQAHSLAQVAHFVARSFFSVRKATSADVFTNRDAELVDITGEGEPTND